MRCAPVFSGVLVGALAVTGWPVYGSVIHEMSPAAKKFEQALDQTPNLHLPLNRAYLYRQAARAVLPASGPYAIDLLKRALSEIDADETTLRAQGPVQDKAQRQLAMARRSTILQMLRIDPAETLRMLAPSQTADADIDLQRQVFERIASNSDSVKRVDAVLEAGQRKLESGVTPAAVAGYDVLRRHDPTVAKLFGAEIVFRLKTINPASDSLAVTSAFALLKVQRSEGGWWESKTKSGSSALNSDSLATLYEFIGDAFLAAQDPAVLVLTQKPAEYMQAMRQYNPEKADEVTKAIAAAAASLTASQNSGSLSPHGAGSSDALTPDEQQKLEATQAEAQARLAAQIRETIVHTRLLAKRVAQKDLSTEERDIAALAVVEEANRSISLGRVLAKDLEPEAFQDGELEFYLYGPLNGVIERASSILQTYALAHPAVAEDAASRLDGPEVQIEVELQIAIREMKGHEEHSAGDREDRDNRRHGMWDQIGEWPQ